MLASFPAVATVIGVSQEVAESGPLLATLAIDPSIITGSTQAQASDPIEIKAEDPVTQAVVDNIIGKLPTEIYPGIRCDICNIKVSSEEILQIHYAGAKHARKVKGQELIKEITNSVNSKFVTTNAENGFRSKVAEFTCTICSVTVTSYQQLQQHLSGSKHKAKANKSNIMEVPSNTMGDKGVVNVDIGPNRLYCAACNIHVNSDLQLHQHVTSRKHANKVNGRAAPLNGYGSTPYTRRPARGFKGGTNSGNSSRSRGNRNNTGWSPSNSGFGLSGNRLQQFVPGGVMHTQ